MDFIGSFVVMGTPAYLGPLCALIVLAVSVKA